MNESLAKVAAWLGEARRVVALTGAGISTESGIPDFRGPHGVWTKNPAAEKLSNIHAYMSDAEVRKAAWKARIDHPGWRAEPNVGHRALADLERRGRLHALVTQNIDGLHQRAGNTAEKVIEVHGTMRDVMCMSCGWRGPMQDTLDRVRAGEDDPPCLRCGGILKSATISFGQPMPVEAMRRAEAASRECDLFIVLGSSLLVYPAAALPIVAKSNGAALAIVNREPTDMDGRADVVVHAEIGAVLREIVT